MECISFWKKTSRVLPYCRKHHLTYPTSGIYMGRGDNSKYWYLNQGEQKLWEGRAEGNPFSIGPGTSSARKGKQKKKAKKPIMPVEPGTSRTVKDQSWGKG